VKLRAELSCLARTKNRVRYVFHSADFMARLPDRCFVSNPAYRLLTGVLNAFRDWDVLFLCWGRNWMYVRKRFRSIQYFWCNWGNSYPRILEMNADQEEDLRAIAEALDCESSY